jgi:hypothetical protein
VDYLLAVGTVVKRKVMGADERDKETSLIVLIQFQDHCHLIRGFSA